MICQPGNLLGMGGLKLPRELYILISSVRETVYLLWKRSRYFLWNGCAVDQQCGNLDVDLCI